MNHANGASTSNRSSLGNARGEFGLSTRCCTHAAWIVQPSRKRYLYHCRACSVIIIHDIENDIWRISHDPSEGENMAEEDRQNAFASLDDWMNEREATYRHPIFVHPERERG
jgi:hypothetical protein